CPCSKGLLSCRRAWGLAESNPPHPGPAGAIPFQNRLRAYPQCRYSPDGNVLWEENPPFSTPFPQRCQEARIARGASRSRSRSARLQLILRESIALAESDRDGLDGPSRFGGW